MSGPEQQERFLGLLDEHRKILYKVARSYCRRPEDTEDLTQEMVVQLWRSFDRFDVSQRFSTWMYRIALNVAISFHRRTRRRRRDTVEVEGAVLDFVAAPPETAPLEEDLRLLHEHIGQLGELDRAIVILYLDGNRHEVIAEVLGISETNVGTRFGRIKERLRRDLSRTV